MKFDELKLKRPGCLAVFTLLAALGWSEELDLAGTWTLTRADDPSVTCPIAVPGGVHSALRKANLMVDPFWGRNELKTQDIGRREWAVARTFDCPAGILERKAAVLRLEDVDTFATVSLNGHELGRTDNRFRRWDFDVRPYLKPGRNELKGVFASSELRANELAKGLPENSRTTASRCCPAVR